MGVWLTARHGVCCAAGSMVSTNYLYGPLPDCFFDKCISQILYGSINRDFENMVADGNALINLAHNFYFGDAVLYAAGCKVCPTEVSEPNNLEIWDTSLIYQDFGGRCSNPATHLLDNNPMVQSGKTTRVILSGNCLTLSPRTKCTSKGTEHSAAACQAFCSITDNGPCDGHGACVPATPTSPSNFTCICDAGYTTVDSGNGSSTCAIVHSTTNTVSSLSTGAIVGIVVGCFAGFTLLTAVVAWLLWPRGPSEPLNPFHIPPCCTYFLASFLAPHLSQFPCLSSALMLDSPLPSCSPLLCPHALLSSTLMLSSPLPSCSPLLCPHALLSSALMLSSPLPSCPALLCPHALLSSALMLSSLLPSCSPLLCPHARLSSALMISSPLPSCPALLCPHALLSSALMPGSTLPSCSVHASTPLVPHTSGASHGLSPPHTPRAPAGLLPGPERGDGQAGADPRLSCCLSLPFLVSVLPVTASPCCHAGLHCLSLLSCCLSLPFLVFLLSSTSLASCHAALHCLAIHHPCVHIPLQAMKLVEVYELEELKDSKMPVASEEAIVDFADPALDCIKSPGTRRPTMKDVAYRLSALIAKHCPNKEDEWENVAEEDGASNVDTGTSSRDVSAVSLGDRGRESERSYGSQSGVSSLLGLRSWVQLKTTNGR
ncbi:unnamed protein product [Closterium sp. Naga37s-1]|nr:unnamed protein product [Closterium sp. Naga37s-1]